MIRRGIERLFFGGGTSKKATLEGKKGVRASLDLRKGRQLKKVRPLSKRKSQRIVFVFRKEYEDGDVYNHGCAFLLFYDVFINKLLLQNKHLNE